MRRTTTYQFSIRTKFDRIDKAIGSFEASVIVTSPGKRGALQCMVGGWLVDEQEAHTHLILVGSLRRYKKKYTLE